MVKDSNERVMITLSKAQAKWLRENAKKMDMTLSRFVKFLIDKNMANLVSKLPPQALDQLIKIARVQWIRFDDEEDYEW